MSGLASINIKFSADLKDFSKKIQNANRSIQKVGKQMQKVGAGLSVGLTAPLLAFSAVALKNWDKQAKAISQVENGLKSTGNAVGFTSGQLQKMASDLQNTSLFGDEDILQGVTTQLLTFTNIAGTQFARTQQAALDLSAKLGTDLKSSSIQLGKALNDPVANLSALSRSGIQFSTEQKAVIKSLVETNRLADAQTIILNELEKQYGGSAAAAAKAGLGPFKQLSNSIGDLTEDFGKIIGQALLPFIAKIKEMVQGFQKLSPATKKIIVVVGSLVAALGPLLVALGLLMTTVIPGLTAAFSALSAAMLANPVGIVLTAVVALSAAVVLFSSNLKGLTSVTDEWSSVTKTATSSIAEEKAELQRGLAVAKDENRSKKERLAAIRTLKKQYPKYLDFLNLETINTDRTKVATNQLIASMLQKAKVQAAQGKLVEIEKKLLDLQLGQNDAIDPTLWQQLGASMKGFGSVARTQMELSKSIGKNYSEEKTALESLRESLQNYLVDNESIVKALKEVTVAGTNLNTVISGPVKRNKVSAIDTSGLFSDREPSFGIADAAIIEGQALGSSLLGIQENLIDFSSETSGILSGAAANFTAGFAEIIGGLFSGTASMADVAGLLLSTIGDLAVQLGEAAIAIGVGMIAIKAAFSNPFTAIAAGVALVAVGSIIKGIASQFSGGQDAGAFANGGVVGGNSPIGDKLFARVNSGEMILNQRQQNNLSNAFAGSAGQSLNITLGGKLTADAGKLQAILDSYSTKKQRRV